MMGYKVEGKSSRRKVLALQRESEAVALRIQGKSYSQIAVYLGMTPGAAHAVVWRAMGKMSKLSKDKAEECRALDTARMDEMLVSLWPKRDEPATANTILGIMNRRAKMYGIDEPAKIDLADTTAIEYMKRVSARADEIKRERMFIESGTPAPAEIGAELDKLGKGE